MQIILASASPRRRELFSEIGVPFAVIPAVGEERSSAADPRDMVVELAFNKAQEIFLRHPESIVVACDTVVDLNGEVMGKPRSEEDAYRMLNALSGKTHKVHTGVCVLSCKGKWQFCETTLVRFRELSQREIRDYIQNGEPFDKAGAYGIQDDCRFVAGIEGDYDNVMGMPTYKIKLIIDKIYKR